MGMSADYEVAIEEGATIVRVVMALFTLSTVIWFDRKLERGTAGLAIFLTATFYASLASRLTGVDVSSESFRNQVSPLNTPADASLVAAVRDASTSSFHLAMLLGAALLLVGAVVNAVGIQNSARAQPVAGKEPVSATSA